MSLPSKQQAILDYVRTNGNITTAVANQMLKAFYYHNHEKYISEILGRMVKNGSLNRVKNGLYELGSGKKSDYVVTNQPNLF